MNTTVNATPVQKFIGEIEGFPASANVSISTYDTNKLVGILREKEVLSSCNATKEDWDQLNNIDISFGKVVKDLVKEVNLEASYKEYLELEKKIEDSVSGSLYIYAKQAALSVKALYFYKNGDFEKGITTTLECIVLNEYLVKTGIGTLNLRCFEQNKNISRILLRSGRKQEGYDLLFNLLNYLFNGVEKDLYGNLFRETGYWNIVPILRETYAYELFPMLAEDMIRFNLKDTSGFLPSQWYLNLDFEVNTPSRQVIYNWIYINKQRHHGNYDEYFDSLTYFFQQPLSAYYDMLKISLLIDLGKVAKSSYGNDEEAMGRRIRKYLAEKMTSNEKLRGYLIEHVFSTSNLI
jgi:hypothetical protein